jgi:hypothetical protein
MKKISYFLFLSLFIFSFGRIAAQDSVVNVFHVCKTVSATGKGIPVVRYRLFGRDSIAPDTLSYVNGNEAATDSCGCNQKEGTSYLDIYCEYIGKRSPENKRINMGDVFIYPKPRADQKDRQHAAIIEAYISVRDKKLNFTGNCINSRYSGIIKDADGLQIGSWSQQ